MDTWKNHKIPTASDLFWMIPHERETSDEVNIIIEDISFQ